MSISLKEANETNYWVELLHDTNFIENSIYKSLQTDCNELIAILVSTVKTSKRNE